ncbi:MAG: zinc ABC transporter substrate-binding protein [Lentisphaeria bacterium]
MNLLSIILIFLFLQGLAMAQPLRTVFVSVPPQLEAVQKIAGSEVQVEVLVPPGMNPENYTLRAKTISALSRADAVFLIGVEFENVLRTRLEGTLKTGALVETRSGMTLRSMEAHADSSHAAHQQGNDPHVWLDVDNMIVYARQVGATFSRLDPTKQKEYAERTEEYCQELQRLKIQIEELLSKYKGRRILVVHPAFGYLLDSFGIGQLSVEKAGKEPGARQLSQLLRTARDEKLRVIFTQPQFSDKSARILLQQLSCSILTLDPLPEPYCQGMLKLAHVLQRGLNEP